METIKANKHLVYGTWIIAVCAIVSSTIGYYTLSEYKAERIFQERPFIKTSAKSIESEFHIYFITKDSTLTDREINLDEIPISALFSEKQIKVRVNQKRYIHNIGLSPMYLKAGIYGCIFNYEWNNISGSYQKLIDNLVESSGWHEQCQVPKDILIYPKDSADIQLPFFDRTYAKSDLEEFFISGESITVLPYIYIQYEDIWGNLYNHLTVNEYNYEVSTNNNKIQFIQQDTSTIITRWDVE